MEPNALHEYNLFATATGMIGSSEDTEKKYVAAFRWANITEQFEGEFKQTFLTDKKVWSRRIL